MRNKRVKHNSRFLALASGRTELPSTEMRKSVGR